LITGIVHNQSDGCLQAKCSDFLQELADALRIDVAVIGDGNKLMSDGVEGTEHMKALSTTWGTHHHPRETPQKAKVSREHKMGRIHKKDGSLAGFRFFSTWL
jgi:hypothetical protein